MPPVETSDADDRPRVAQIVTRMDVGGVPDHVVTLIRGLQPKYAVTVISGQTEPKYEQMLAAAGVPLVSIDFRRLLHPFADIRSVIALVRIMREGRFDIVHTHMSKAVLVGSIAAKIARVPAVVNTAHNLGFVAMPHAALRGLFWIYDRLLFSAAVDTVITVSESVRQRIVRAGLIPSKKTAAIPNGIDISRFESNAVESAKRRAEFSRDPDAVLIVTVARLVWFKGLDTLIDAAQHVFAECPHALLVIVGAGPLGDRLREQAARLGIADRVRFTGERDDIPAILGAADIFVLSSVSEGQPISILEAMASGKPVVATAVGGVPEVVVDGKTGILTPPRTADALASGLVKLTNDPELRRAMGAEGRQRVVQEFSASAMVLRTAAVYERLLHRGTSSDVPSAAVGEGLCERRDLLVRQDYVSEYRRQLQSHLPSEWAPFSEFFSDMSRLLTLARMLNDHFSGSGKLVLNVGSGPFATEIFVAALQRHTIVSFDYTCEFAGFFNLFRGQGLLSGGMFVRANALTIQFLPHRFDLIIMHDILYEKTLDLGILLKRFGEFLAPGGLLYFDFMNERTRWLWRLLGKEKDYRRYSILEVERLLRENGFEIVEQASAGSSSRVWTSLFHSAVRRLLRTSNTIAVIARKRP